MRVRAEVVFGEGSEAQGLKAERAESVSGGQQGAGLALAELQAAPGTPHGRRALCSLQLLGMHPGQPHQPLAGCAGGGLTSGRCGTGLKGLFPFIKEKGAGSQVLSCWAVWEGGGTCCPSCSGEGWELPDVITSFSSSPTSLCTYHYDDLFC